MKLNRFTKIAVAALVLAAAAVIFLRPDISIPPAQAAAESLLAPRPADFIMGNAKAPVTMVEYFSTSCSHCAHFHNDVLPQLSEKYIKPGKLKFIARSFVRNEPDLKATLLLQCVPREKYFTFLKVLFQEQEKWAFDENFLASLKIIAGVGGISGPQFDKCMANTAAETAALKERKEATDILLVNATPMFFVNGKKYEGAYDIPSFSKEIDRLLAGGQN